MLASVRAKRLKQEGFGSHQIWQFFLVKELSEGKKKNPTLMHLGKSNLEWKECRLEEKPEKERKIGGGKGFKEDNFS